MKNDERRRLRQRMVEVLAADVLGVSKGALGGWRTQGRVPHKHRVRLLGLAQEVGLPLDHPADFENWQKVGER